MNAELSVVSSVSADREYLLGELKKATTTEFDKARIEQRLWESASDEEKGDSIRRAWLTRITGARPSEIEKRGTLLAAGAAANLLWERVLKGKMTTHLATSLLSDARWLARRDGTTEALGVVKVLKQYDEAPITNNAGHKARLERPAMRGASKATQFYRGGRRFDMKPTTAPTERVRTPVRSNTPLAEANRFWSSIREQVAEFMRSRLPQHDEIVVERLISEMMGDLKVLTGSWSAKIGRAASAETSAMVVTRARMIAACRTLCIDPPKMNKPIDLTTANVRKKALARAYHPDGSGSEATREQYQAVLDAYGVLEEYAEQYGEVKKGRAS